MSNVREFEDAMSKAQALQPELHCVGFNALVLEDGSVKFVKSNDTSFTMAKRDAYETGQFLVDVYEGDAEGDVSD